VISLDYDYLYSENALLENLQATFLILSAIAYLWLSTYCRGQVRLGWIAASLLCFSFVTREVDIELLPLFESVGFLFHGLGRTIMLLGLWAFYIKILVAQEAHKGCISAIFDSKYFHYFVLSFLLLVCGAIFDREIFVLEYGKLFEELVETNAYLFLLLPSLYELYSKHRYRLFVANNLNTEAD
jgi:hypothetical protein